MTPWKGGNHRAIPGSKQGVGLVLEQERDCAVRASGIVNILEEGWGRLEAGDGQSAPPLGSQ